MIIQVIEAAMTGLTKLPDQRHTVHVIDPDEHICDGLTTFLGTLDIPVRCYSNAEAFLDANSARSPTQDCLLVDANLQGMGTRALLKQLRRARLHCGTAPRCPFVPFSRAMPRLSWHSYEGCRRGRGTCDSSQQLKSCRRTCLNSSPTCTTRGIGL